MRRARMERFWRVYRDEYVRHLPAVVPKFGSKGSVRVGSVVMIRRDNVPRMRWPMATEEAARRQRWCDPFCRRAYERRPAFVSCTTSAQPGGGRSQMTASRRTSLLSRATRAKLSVPGRAECRALRSDSARCSVFLSRLVTYPMR